MFLLSIAGCSTLTHDRDPAVLAGHRLRVADSLETALAFREATHQYTSIAEAYPGSVFFSTAARKAALLYLHPANEMASDSAALYWFRKSLGAPQASPDRTVSETFIRLLEQTHTLRETLVHQKAVSDSLGIIAKKQSAELSTLVTRSRQVQSLEADLKRANDELQKLREVDVRMSKEKQKK